MLRALNAGLVCLGIVMLAVGAPPAVAKDTIWHVKAVHPKGHLLDVKAVGEDGTLYDVNAIEQDGNVVMLDVKAFVDGDPRPVKVVVSDERYAPVMAIDVRGKNLPVRVFNLEGKQYEVRAMRRQGSVLSIRGIGLGSRTYPLKAVAPDGRMYDIRGIKMTRNRVESVIGTIQVHAHVKALPPPPSE